MNSKPLTHFVEDLTGDAHLRVQDDLGNGYVRLRAAEAQRRQAQQDIRTFEDVVIEMLRNARDAGASAIFVATYTENGFRYLTMIDDASGIPASMHETVFEPFVTSKLDSFHEDRWGVHGRGMALYSIKQNVSDAHIVASEPGLGSVFYVCNNQQKLIEKRDQSTLPTIAKNENGGLVLRGPHNIARTVMEFAIDERKNCAVYLGSPSEIVATLFYLGQQAALRMGTLLSTYTDETPYIQRFGYSESAEDLAQLANSYSLNISTRTAHRIMSGEVKPLQTQLEVLASLQSSHNPGIDSSAKEMVSRSVKPKPAKQIKLNSEDLETLRHEIQTAFDNLAESYYLQHDVAIEVKQKGSTLVVSIPLNPDV